MIFFRYHSENNVNTLSPSRKISFEDELLVSEKQVHHYRDYSRTTLSPIRQHKRAPSYQKVVEAEIEGDGIISVKGNFFMSPNFWEK